MAKLDLSYRPRAGTKVAVALDLIKQQPRTTRELCTLLSCTCNAVRSMLIRPLSHGAIIKTTDAEGRVYFNNPHTEPADTVKDTCVVRQRRAKNIHLVAKPPLHKTTSTKNKSAPCRKERRASKEHAHSAEIASGLIDGGLTIAANGKSINLDAKQRQQLYSYLQKIQGIQ